MERLGGGYPLFARWTEEYDCIDKTEWWYVIKDTSFDIKQLKAKRRYEINKGNKNFIIKRIDPTEYVDELLKVLINGYKSWPEKYRPTVNVDRQKQEFMKWKKDVVYAAFFVETGELVGYAKLSEKKEVLEFNILRVDSEYERYGVNAAIVYKIVQDYNERLGKTFYILDGSRAIRHETKFQDYLEKYFGFRKAYCKLRIKYRFPIGIIVKILFPFRNKINSENKIGNMIVSVLRMEEIRRKCQ